MNKANKKGGNKRCPFTKQCDRVCEHVGSELGCNYYKYNACGSDVIEDQERIRKQLEDIKRREMDEELIEALDDDEKTGILVMLAVDRLFPHPDNPRKDLGDVTELSESIKAKGIMQNLTVVPRKGDEGNYTVIIGHRRLAAAKKAGLDKVPCVITEMSEQDQLATMLLENIQRSDLTAYEQAKGFQLMIDFGETVSGIVEKTGFSDSTVRRRLKMNELDEKILREVSGRQLNLLDLDKLHNIEDKKERDDVLKKIGTAEFNSAYREAIGDQERRKKLAEFEAHFDAAGLTKLTSADYTKYSYHKAITTLSDIDKEIENVKERGVIAYYHAYSTTYYMMTKKGEVTKTKEQEEGEQKELDRKKRSDMLKEASSRAYNLRREFIKDYSNRAAVINLNKIAAYLVCSGFNGDLFEECGKGEFEDLMFGRECELSSYEECCDMIHSSDSAKAILIVAWLLTDNKTLNAYDYYGAFDENPRLNMLYDFLEAIGYEMSEDERGLITGESELYVKDNN